ncbi:MAG: hypothetical protein N3C57_04500, partial [Aquificaceae bacterium]|nr:hypothetical protein [Aquificaceae bacterium]
MEVLKVEGIAGTPKMVASQPVGEDFVATLLEAMEGEKKEVIAQGGMELSQLLLVLPLGVSPAINAPLKPAVLEGVSLQQSIFENPQSAKDQVASELPLESHARFTSQGGEHALFDSGNNVQNQRVQPYASELLEVLDQRVSSHVPTGEAKKEGEASLPVNESTQLTGSNTHDRELKYAGRPQMQAGYDSELLTGSNAHDPEPEYAVGPRAQVFDTENPTVEPTRREEPLLTWKTDGMQRAEETPPLENLKAHHIPSKPVESQPSDDTSSTQASLQSSSEKGFTVMGDYPTKFHRMQEGIPSQLLGEGLKGDLIKPVSQRNAEGDELLDLQEEGDPTGLTELFEGNNQKPPEAFQAEPARKSQRLLKDAEPLQKEFESLQKDAEPEREGGLRKSEGQEGDKEGYAFYQQTPEKANAVEENQEVRTEVVRRQPIVNQEHRRLSMHLEEANVRMNLLGDRLRLYINMAEEAYRQPTALEVQRLVQSLQNLGYNLEVLK